MNTINVTGRLTRDPELRTTPNQVPVCSFTLAVERPVKKDSNQEKVDFIDVVTNL